MIGKLALSFLVLAFIGQSLHIFERHQAAILDAGIVNLIADNGDYLTACNGCGNAVHNVSASVQPLGTTNASNWQLVIVGNQVAFKGSNGRFLSRCLNCWYGSKILPNNGAFVQQLYSSGPFSKWTPQQLANGKYAFKGDTGLYLARCQACVNGATSPSQVFINQADSSSPLAQWTLKYVVPNGKFQMQADNGQFLTLCTSGCGSTVTKNVGVAAIRAADGDNSVWTFKSTTSASHVTITGNNGNFLARCNGCWRGAAYNNAAFVHTKDNAPYSKWAPERIGKKWAFKSDTGKYLARCQGCVTLGAKFSNYAFVHEANSANQWAQWTLVVSA